MTLISLSGCAFNARTSPVVNSVCARYSPIILSDASFAGLSRAEKLAVVNHNDKYLADCRR